MGEVIRLQDWSWRRTRRPRTRLAQSLAVLEPEQREVVLALLTLFAPLGERLWTEDAAPASSCDDAGVLRTYWGTPLADLPDDGLSALCLEAGYTVGNADTFKAVLPYFLAGVFARPLNSWVIDPDLLKAKLETLDFEAWPALERRTVARALAVFAQHEIDLADGPTTLDQSVLDAKRWAEEEIAAAP